jgi:hypothetical protein
MSDTTPNLALPYIMPAQAQKHVTHNEAVRALDALVQISVADRDLAVPPGGPSEGDRYIVAASPSEGWAGQAARIAAWQDGGWAFYVPREGWLAWVADENALLVFDGVGWNVAAVTSVNPIAAVGINATADTTNRLAVSAPASLFNHAGGGHQQKINKADAGQTASVLLQTAFSGRAELGLTGDDDLHFKVSANGSVWRDALVISSQTGTPRLPSLTKAALPSAAAAGAGALAHVSDEAGGPVLAFSDGASWRRVTDRAVVS